VAGWHHCLHWHFLFVFFGYFSRCLCGFVIKDGLAGYFFIRINRHKRVYLRGPSIGDDAGNHEHDGRIVDGKSHKFA
jgi:hypothetical protein